MQEKGLNFKYMALTLTNTRKSVRSTNIELLRIVAMLFIILSHCFCHGNFSFNAGQFPVSRFLYHFSVIGGNFGVDLFVLISGYFLITGNKLVVAKKALILWEQLFFYSVAIFTVFIVFYPSLFSLKEVLRLFLPITHGGWWFASTYFVLFIIHPFLNKLLLALSKKQYQFYLAVIIFLWSFLPTIIHNDLQANELIQFIMLYSISGYIRLYKNTQKIKTWIFVALSSFLYLLTYLSEVVLMFAETKIEFLSPYKTIFIDRYKIPVLFSAVFLFLAFTQIKIKLNMFINTVASSTFGIYLIHDHPRVREYIWTDLFKINTVRGVFIIPYTLFVVITVFTVCSIIDLIRQNTFGVLFTRINKKVFSIVSKPINFIGKTIRSFFGLLD